MYLFIYFCCSAIKKCEMSNSNEIIRHLMISQQGGTFDNMFSPDIGFENIMDYLFPHDITLFYFYYLSSSCFFM